MATIRFNGRQFEHRLLVRVHRFAHRVCAPLQSVRGFARTHNLRIQCEDAINRGARIDRDLPFLPGDIQID